MNRKTAKKTATAKPSNLARSASSTADVAAENGAGRQMFVWTLTASEPNGHQPQKIETLLNSSPLASRLRDDLVLAGLSDETQISYVREIKKMAAYFNLSPDSITENNLRQYPDCGVELGPGVFEPYSPTTPMTIDTS